MTLATAAKVAATVLTNDKLRKTVGWIIAAVLSPLIVLMVIVFGFMSGGADHNAAVLDLCYYGGTIAGSVPEAYRQRHYGYAKQPRNRRQRGRQGKRHGGKRRRP